VRCFLFSTVSYFVSWDTLCESPWWCRLACDARVPIRREIRAGRLDNDVGAAVRERALHSSLARDGEELELRWGAGGLGGGNLRAKAKVPKNLCDGLGFGNPCDDFSMSSAVWTQMDVLGENSREQFCPTHASGFGCCRSLRCATRRVLTLLFCRRLVLVIVVATLCVRQ